jgi:regulatory protein
MEDKGYTRAKGLAYRYLAAGPRSLAELVSYLQKKEIIQDYISRVAEDLKSYSYIDERKFAATYARYLLQTKGLSRYALRFELKRKGVSESDIEAGLEDLFGGEDAENEEEVALRIARRKMESMKGVDREKARKRVTDYLRRRGYGFGVIAKVLKG